MTTEEAIKELRDASDDEVRYGDTEHHYSEVMKRIEAFELAIKALEQEPCEDCISREAVDEYITNLLSGYLYDEERTRLEDLSAFVWELPSVIPKYTDEEIDKAQAVEQAYVDKMVELAVEETKRPTGKWIDIGDEGLVFKCSLCGMKTTIESHYCPNCGAKMAESEVVE